MIILWVYTLTRMHRACHTVSARLWLFISRPTLVRAFCSSLSRTAY